MRHRHLASLTMLSAASLLASCSGGLSCGNSHPYATNTSRPPLTAPPGVTLPAPDPAYLVPAAGSATRAIPAPGASTNGAQPCLVIPPKVLTNADMARPAGGAAKPSAAPAAATAPTKPAPAPGTHVPPVAAGGAME
jgi:hypothetical protein